MQVGFLLEQCLAPVPGGTGRYSRELAAALVRTAPSGARVLGLTAWHRRQVEVPGVRGPLRLPLGRRALTTAWQHGLGPGAGGDLVHAPTPLAPPRRDRPLVVTVHDTVPWTHPETLTPRGVRWHRQVITRAARTADLIVVPTQAVATELARRMGLVDVAVIGEGVSPGLVLPADADERAARLGLPERFLLTVATLEPRKGLGALIEALRGLPGLPLLCVGQAGWGGQDIRALATAAGVDVRVLGRLPDADLAVLYARATALVVPSLAEGFGLPLLEGMSFGTPVLTSDAPALVEVAGGAALAVPLAELADGLRTITGDQALRDRLGGLGPQRAAAFSWDAAARQHWDAYSRLLGAPPRA